MSSFPLQYVRAIQTGVYHLARHFGFQQFNYSLTTKRWVPAVAGLAADQLVSLLQDAALRRCATNLAFPRTTEAWEPVFLRALSDVYTEYFEEYDRWCNKLQLPEPQNQRQQPEQHVLRKDPPLQLLELGLQFLIYTEAANLRHTPHLMFLIYYIMRGSQAFQQALRDYTYAVQHPAASSSSRAASNTLPYTHWRYWFHCSADNFGGNKPSGYDVTSLRLNLLQQLYNADPKAFHYEDPTMPVEYNKTQDLADAINGIIAVSWSTADNPQLQQMTRGICLELQQTFKYGQQQVFLNNVVQPLFYFLAEQMDLAGHQGGEEAALRIAYCDVDEACCSPGGVHNMLDALRDEGWKRMDILGSRHCRDLWNALLQVMQPLTPTEEAELNKNTDSGFKKLLQKLKIASQDMQGGVNDRYPRDPQRVIVLENLKQLLKRVDEAEPSVDLDAQVTTEEKAKRKDKKKQLEELRKRIRAEVLKHVTADCKPALTNESEAISMVYERAKYGAAWWSGNLFKAKTFVEARSLAAPFVAFWRVYNFHAVLFTAMLAVSFVVHKSGGIWRKSWERPTPIDPWQMLAALALSTVADSLMRVLRNAAYLMLYSYNRAVVRTQVTLGEEEKPKIYKIDPFPSGAWKLALNKSVKLLLWLIWSAFLALCVLPAVVESLTQPFEAIPSLTKVLHDYHVWLLPAAVHAFVFWGGSAFRQKSGYTTGWIGMLHDFLDWINSKRRRGAASGGKWRALAGHADCAVDSKIDALFYPSRYLETDRQRSWVNSVLWIVVILVKITFEFFLVLQPLVKVINAIIGANGTPNVTEETFDSQRMNVNTVFNWIVTYFQVVAVTVPAALISLSDTGLLYSVAGGIVSAILGFNRGVGSMKTWVEMVPKLTIILDNYKRHCVSRSALMLHLQGHTDANKLPYAVQQLSISALAAGWNAMVYDLRQRDLLSNKELACVTFEQLLLSPAQEKYVKDLGLTTVLPARCFVAGAVPEVTSTEAGSAHQLYVASLCWQWFCWLLLTCQIITEQDMKALLFLKLPHPAPSRPQAQRRQELLKEAVTLIKLLSSSGASPSNMKAAVAAAADGGPFTSAAVAADAVRKTAYTGLMHGMKGDQQMKAYWELRHCLEALLKSLRQEVKEMQSNAKHSVVSRTHVDALAGALDRLEKEWACWLRPEAAAANVHSTQQAQMAKKARERVFEEDRFRDKLRQSSIRDAGSRAMVLMKLEEAGRHSPAAAQVAGWLLDALTQLLGDTIPSDDEAQRFIVSFAASLNDPNLKVAPALQVMPSMTTLTPHYAEDVIYALSESDAWSDILKRNAELNDEKGFRFNMPADPSKLAGRKDVIYLMKADDTPSDTMRYLRSVYCRQLGTGSTQWDNFVERIKGMADADGLDLKTLPARINEFHFLPNEPLHGYKEELLLWASCRGQLLARTVRGMMTYRTALAAIANFENPQLATAGTAPAAVGEPQSSSSSGGAGTSTSSCILQPDAMRTAILDDLLDRKFNYIVSSQNLGEFGTKVASDLKASWLVHAIKTLMHRHPALKVAFIDKHPLVAASRPPGMKVEIRRDCSVLWCSVRQQELARAVGMHVAADEPQREAYRVQLPINFESGRGVVIGEGKPENQNHAITFCHSEAIQTIDCNQDNLVAEGLKLRNLLAEFLPDGWDQIQRPGRMFSMFRSLTMGSRANKTPQPGKAYSNTDLLDEIPKGKGRVALVGFREWIFSEDSGALAEFAAATEKSFGTTVQRLMHWPGAVRFHYGHPDVWRRSFVATCGGVSKANKGLHVSEDVFGGYNTMLRGRDIKYVDYIAVGKGRDMSMETICTFEAKIASGNGEQVLSREIRRLGHSMDFMRLMSWYHTGNGFFINTAITMLSVHATVWVMLLMAFLQKENKEVQSWLSAVQILQLGTLSVLVYWITLVLDSGLFLSVWIIIKQVLQGSLMFYILRAQTSAYSFTQDVMFGGAKYLATGRGYKLQASSFKDLWRRFGRSHMYFGAVMTVYCLAILAAKSKNGSLDWPMVKSLLLVLWAPVLVIISLLFGPFWFTPFAFRTDRVQQDMDETQRWFLSPSLNDSWQAWNKEFTDVWSGASGKQMGRLATCIRAHVMKLPTVLMLLAVASRLNLRSTSVISKAVVMIIIAAGIILLFSVIQASSSLAARSSYKYQGPRLAQLAAYIILIAGVLSSGAATSGDVGELGNAPLVLFSMFILLRLLPLFFYNPLLRRWFAGITNGVYFAADAALAAVLECTLFVLSVFDILTGLQAQLLFGTAYAKQVMSDSNLEQSEVSTLFIEALRLERQQRQEQLPQQQQQQAGQQQQRQQ